MAFNFGSLLGIVKMVAKTPLFQQAAISLISSIGNDLINKADNPEAVRNIAKDLSNGAAVIVGAMVKNTEAEDLVDKRIIPDPNNRKVAELSPTMQKHVEHAIDKAGGSSGL